MLAQLQTSINLRGAVTTSGEQWQGWVVRCLPLEGQQDAELHMAELHMAELPGQRRCCDSLIPACQQNWGLSL